MHNLFHLERRFADGRLYGQYTIVGLACRTEHPLAETCLELVSLGRLEGDHVFPFHVDPAHRFGLDAHLAKIQLGH